MTLPRKIKLKHRRKIITCPECGSHKYYDEDPMYVWCGNCHLDYLIEDGFCIRRMAQGSYYG